MDLIHDLIGPLPHNEQTQPYSLIYFVEILFGCGVIEAANRGVL